MDNILDEIRSELRQQSDEKTRLSGQRFFKEEVLLYGMKAGNIRKIAKEKYEGIKYLSKEEIFGLCENLWQSGYFEESAIACEWSWYFKKAYEPADFQIFERWVERYVSNWASCDTLCNHTVGTFVESFPEYTNELKRWTRSKNRWMRRAAAVSLIVPARKGKFLREIFEIAGALITDKDDMVQKGYGWMLKAASEANQSAVFDFVMEHKREMPRTALRYAIEKMPPDLKKKAMQK